MEDQPVTATRKIANLSWFIHEQMHFFRTQLVELILQNQYDIIGVQERRLSDKIPIATVCTDGYNFVRGDRDTFGGGVGFYIRSSLNYEIIKKLKMRLWKNFGPRACFNLFEYVALMFKISVRRRHKH
ncbi:hypothetical protein NQ317_008619 [Molorchus minor]|uniref:Uncharacterized protein n=1 Tax=Molorchus minor TaxID=1323400 RepID=A0ABQ9J9P9_9CUCU|nr:hypothetical protein NQ317_008619 [Molorchus minor]